MQEFAENNRYLVRSLDFGELREDMEIDDASYSEIGSQVRQIFQRLESYGIDLPSAQYVIGNNTDGVPSLMILIDRIDGQAISQLEPFDPNKSSKYYSVFAQTCDNLGKYIEESIYKQVPYLSDISGSQFMLGKSPVDGQERLYMVDFDANLCHPGLPDAEVQIAITLANFDNLIRESKRILNIPEVPEVEERQKRMVEEFHRQFPDCKVSVYDDET